MSVGVTWSRGPMAATNRAAACNTHILLLSLDMTEVNVLLLPPHCHSGADWKSSPANEHLTEIRGINLFNLRLSASRLLHVLLMWHIWKNFVLEWLRVRQHFWCLSALLHGLLHATWATYYPRAHSPAELSRMWLWHHEYYVLCPPTLRKCIIPVTPLQSLHCSLLTSTTAQSLSSGILQKCPKKPIFQHDHYCKGLWTHP